MSKRRVIFICVDCGLHHNDGSLSCKKQPCDRCGREPHPAGGAPCRPPATSVRQTTTDPKPSAARKLNFEEQNITDWFIKWITVILLLVLAILLFAAGRMTSYGAELRLRTVQDINASWLGWGWLYLRQGVRWLFYIAGVIWAFVVNVVIGIISTIIADFYPFLLYVFVIFLAALLVNAFFHPVIVFVYDHLLPVLQGALDLYVTSQNVVLDIYSIVAEIWNQSVEVIGFILYFIIDWVLSSAKIVFQLLGDGAITQLFAAFMEINVIYLQFMMELIKVAVAIPMAVLKYAVIVFKELFKYLLIQAQFTMQVVRYLFEGLFIVIRPIMWSIVWVVNAFSSLFAARKLLSLDSASTVEGGANQYVAALYEAAMTFGSPDLFANMYQQVAYLDDNVGKQPHGFRASLMGSRPPSGSGGGPGGIHNQFYRDNEHLQSPMHIQPPTITGLRPRVARNGASAASFGRKLMEADEEESDDESLFDDDEVYSGGDDDDDDEPEVSQPPVSEPSHLRPSQRRKHLVKHHAADFERWLDDYVAEVGHENALPQLGGMKLKHRPMTSIFNRTHHTYDQMLTRVTHVHVAAHAFEHGFHHVKKEHFDSGHFEWAFNAHAKRKGFQGVDHALRHFATNYRSGFHFVHSNLPALSDWGPLKLLKDMDPEKDTRMYYHDYMRAVAGITTMRELQEFLAQHHTEEELTMIKVGRHLNFAINLEILYSTDCYTTHPRNPLCIPNGPSFRFHSINVQQLLFPFDVNPNTACADLFLPETCSFTNGPHDIITCFFEWSRLINFFREIRYLIYLFDIPWLINPWLIIFLSAEKPSTLVKRLGLIFPWLSPVTNFLAPLPYGQDPTFEQYICIIIHLYDLILGIVFLIICYYILAPIVLFLYEVAEGFYILRTMWRQEVMMRYEFLETYDDTLLRDTQISIRRQMGPVGVVSPVAPSGTVPIMSNMMDPESQQSSQPHVRFLPHISERDITVPSDSKVVEAMLLDDDHRNAWFQRNLSELDDLLLRLDNQIEARLSQVVCRFGYAAIDTSGPLSAQRLHSHIDQLTRFEQSRKLLLSNHCYTRAFMGRVRRNEKRKERRKVDEPHVWAGAAAFADPLLHERRDEPQQQQRQTVQRQKHSNRKGD